MANARRTESCTEKKDGDRHSTSQRNSGVLAVLPCQLATVTALRRIVTRASGLNRAKKADFRVGTPIAQCFSGNV